jgi:hypothetical protein
MKEDTPFNTWWRTHHPADWWAADRNGKPLPGLDRVRVADLCRAAFLAGVETAVVAAPAATTAPTPAPRPAPAPTPPTPAPPRSPRAAQDPGERIAEVETPRQRRTRARVRAEAARRAT